MKNYNQSNQTVKKNTIQENLIDLERVHKDLLEAIDNELNTNNFNNLCDDYIEIIKNIQLTYQHPQIINGITL